jgi:hypothetical protein
MEDILIREGDDWPTGYYHGFDEPGMLRRDEPRLGSFFRSACSTHIHLSLAAK